MVEVVRTEQWDIDNRLASLGLTKEQLLEVIQGCVAAYGGCTDNDPPAAKGWEVWRWGVRQLREEFRPSGWEKDDTGGFSTIVNHSLKIRLAVMNTDPGTGLPNSLPQNRARKGSTSERAAENNSRLLPGIEWPLMRGPDRPVASDDYSTWHLCIYIEGDEVRSELSLLNEFANGFFTDCHERIILLGNGGWNDLSFGADSDDSGPEFEINVVRK